MDHKFMNGFISELKKKIPESEYFVKLIEDNFYNGNYRGTHTLQHERKTIETIIIILKTFLNNVDVNGHMLIPPGDDRPNETHKSYEETFNYEKFITELKNNKSYSNNTGQHQTDLYKTIKKQTLKNLFDMGFFEKFLVDSKGVKKFIVPGTQAKGSSKTYISIDEEVRSNLNFPDEKLKKFCSRKIKHFFGLKSEILMKIFIDIDTENRKINTISIVEYTLTLSYFNSKNRFGEFNRYDLVKKAFFELHGNKR